MNQSSYLIQDSLIRIHGEFLGSQLSEIGGVAPGQINLSGEVAPELPPIVVGQRLQEQKEIIKKGLLK